MISAGSYEVYLNNNLVKRFNDKSQIRGFIKAGIMLGADIDAYKIYHVTAYHMNNVTDSIIEDVIKNP